MPYNFLDNVDLVKNQMLNMVLQNLANDPGSPVEGLIYFDTANHVTKVYGHSSWLTLGVVGTDIPLATITEQGDILYGSGAGAVAALAHGSAGQYLKSGGHGANPSWDTLPTMYTHPTTNGYIHIPADGASAQLLQYSSAGTAKWITISGDITIADAGALTIGNAKVTYAKIQDVSATDKILGRVTAGAGSIEEISCTAAGRALLDDASAADQLTTLGAAAASHNHDTAYIAKAVGTAHGDLLYFSASATPAVLAHGTDAQVLTAHTDGSLTWESPSAGHTQNTDTGTTQTTFVLDSGGTPVKIKSAAGAFSLRNGADNANADLTVKNLTCDVLTVNTTVTIEAETVTLHDNIILLDENAATAGASAGIQVERGSTGADASLIWVEAEAAFKYGLAASEIKIARVVTADVGDNTNTTIDVVHNLNTRDVTVALVQKATPYDAVMTSWAAKDANTVTFTFAVTPTSAQYRAVITG